jgi:hypothetical protein
VLEVKRLHLLAILRLLLLEILRAFLEPYHDYYLRFFSRKKSL